MNSEINPPRILLSAFGIHSGGGLVLLRALTQKLHGRLKSATLDTRVQDLNLLDNDADQLLYVRKSFIARLFSLFRLASRATPTDVLLCFNSLPPLWRPVCRVIIYVHAPHYVNMHRRVRYTLLTAVRIWIERQWFLLGVKNCSEIWVQTTTMAEAIRAAHLGVIVKVVPFVDDELAAKLSQISAEQVAPTIDNSKFVFFYPADAVGHKNHVNLLKAWAFMHDFGFTPKLWLTLTPDEMTLVAAQAGVDLASLDNIENFGRISRVEVLSYMSRCSAMIFPSLAETFGLPMLEARAQGVAILAAERDFVRDVCIPAETFDPTSARSISSAIFRFMKHTNSAPAAIFNAEDFLRLLLN
jgi:glycosyltransferase involved in cell wall biosynthesis